jgi:hypothetical protein
MMPTLVAEVALKVVMERRSDLAVGPVVTRLAGLR